MIKITTLFVVYVFTVSSISAQTLFSVVCGEAWVVSDFPVSAETNEHACYERKKAELQMVPFNIIPLSKILL